LRDVAKDIMATGTATTEESQKFTAMMPKSAAMMQDFAAKTQRGEKISQEERNKLNNLMAEEGKQAASQYKDIGRYSKEFATQTNQFTAAANIGKDALKNAANAQDEASAGADGQAAALEKSKQTLAEFSNSMTMALANSGLLDTLMTVFGALALFIQTVVVPIFQVVAPVISSLATSLSNELMPVFNAVGSVIRDNVIPMFYAITDFISDNLIPIGVVVMAALIPALMAAAAATWAVVSPLLIAAAPFIAVGIAVGLLVKGFQMMGGSLSTVTDGIKIYVSMWESLFTFIKFGFATLINKLSFGALGGEMLAEAGEELKAQAAEREALETKIATEMKDNRDKNAADAKKKEEERDKRDKKYAEAKHGAEKKAIDDKAKAEAPSTPGVDVNSGPEAMLKSFATQQKSDLVKVDPKKDEKAAGTPVAKAETVKAELKPPTATAAGEATKKSMASESDKKAQEQKAKEDEKKAGKGGAAGAPVQTGAPVDTNQSTTDSLLKELNTHMAALLKATKENNRIAEQQLSAQQSMSGDLFTSMGA
jgi:hypothetical protein